MKGKVNLCSLLDEGGNLVTADEEKAEVFNAFFASVFSGKTTCLQDNCSLGLVDGASEQNGPPIVQEEEVRQLLRCLDAHKSMGPDGIDPTVMRELADEPAKLLSIIYQQSWLTGDPPGGCGNAVDVVYLDFSKAFDTVSHSTLLEKLAAQGLDRSTLCWVKNCLHGRAQRVLGNGAACSWQPVTSGVPQGSVLGPALFRIFIDNMDEGIESLMSKFADGTKMGACVDLLEGFELQESKVQRMPPWQYLGLSIGKRTIVLQKLAIRTKIRTLADVHQPYGALNWALGELAHRECWVAKQGNLTSNALADLLADEEITRQVTLQNRAVIDYLLLLHGHQCEEFEGLCCFSLSSKVENIHKTIQRMKDMVGKIKRETDDRLSRLVKDWGLSGWVGSILKTSLLILFIIDIALISCGVIKKMIHKLMVNITRSPPVNHATIPSASEEDIELEEGLSIEGQHHEGWPTQQEWFAKCYPGSEHLLPPAQFS
ncbi:hypothetical protein DUI87_33697 [Hirundo rustica rustica]|uniref:Reverse transcriptase domain-containing protein n=1 Tax=Hirundo rustica rustica TaxID=333673 RepID=A0A3M0IST5_HIRRU|nr:hypothetical protein DUI87_33697 [Hirundo rustica rustica]